MTFGQHTPAPGAATRHPQALCSTFQTVDEVCRAYGLLSSAALVVSLAIPLLCGAQDRPNHRHYQKPAGYDRAAAPGVPVAARLQNLGVHTFKVTTASERAQLFVNQGVNLAYGFNHAEAARAFAEAARLDPDCAMAYWGHALVLGPDSASRRRGRMPT